MNWLFNYFILNLVYWQKLLKLKMHILHSIRLKHLKQGHHVINELRYSWLSILNRKRSTEYSISNGNIFCIWLGLDLQIHIWILTQRQQLKTMDCTLYFSSYDKMKNSISILFLSLYDTIYELRKEYTSTVYIFDAVA